MGLPLPHTIGISASHEGASASTEINDIRPHLRIRGDVFIRDFATIPMPISLIAKDLIASLRPEVLMFLHQSIALRPPPGRLLRWRDLPRDPRIATTIPFTLIRLSKRKEGWGSIWLFHATVAVDGCGLGEERGSGQ